MKNKTGAGRKRSFRISLLFMILSLMLVIFMNIVLISRNETARINADGQMRLSSIAGRVETSLFQSERLLESVSLKIDRLIEDEQEADRLLTEYFCKDTIEDISEQSGGSCFNAFAAYRDKLYIDDFVPDESFVLDERTWYVEAKKRMGHINVSEPYIDANTGNMCYTISKMLSDGSTVVGLDFNIRSIQSYIEEMDSAGSDSTSLIVNENGMIIGHSNSDYVGTYAEDSDLYGEIVSRVEMLYGSSFSYSFHESDYTVFSDRTNYDWYLIVCIKKGIADYTLSGMSLYLICFMIIISLLLVFFFIHTYRSRVTAENALSAKEQFLDDLSSKLKKPLSQIINRSEMLSENSDSSSIGEEIGESAKEASKLLDHLVFLSKTEKISETKEEDHSTVSHKREITLITVILIITSIFAVVLNTATQVNWGNTKMQKETEKYYYQLEKWITSNSTIIEVISDSIVAQPGFEKDYDYAVDFLDDIVSEYDDISVAYLCNPEWEHTVLMNNRWEPDENWHVEERQWYIDTLESDDDITFASPYFDEQTGLYCITISKKVYDHKGNFIGILGIDYYLDKLIGILDESYTDSGYAFLTDINGNILNHPNDEYQMTVGNTVNAAELCYRSAFYNYEISFIRDYDSVDRVCLAMAESRSGFTIVVCKNTREIYGNAVFSDLLYIVMFVVCIIIVIWIMGRLTRWQERVNSELKEAADSAISAGKAKNDFLANMSHEIRTPINAVLGMNEMILRECEDGQIIEYSENIQSAGRTLLSLINDILDFSKIESGKMEIIPVEYNTIDLLTDLVNMIRPRAEKKGLTLITEIDKGIPAGLYGDDVRIKQVITNILTNAVKYTQKGNVRLKIRVLEMTNSDVTLEVAVSDTGMGIKEEDLDKLFTSFQRIDEKKNRNIEGTGLGITIVQTLLNMMGSELKVASVYGLGSTFSFIITQKVVDPIAMGSLETKTRRSERHSGGTVRTIPDARILVVDDNETNLLVAKSLLKRTLAKTDTASSGRECIEKLKNNIYDIVFLDHMMPEMDGIETLKKIKENDLAVGTTFIALTANAIQGAKQTYIDAGFDDYLSKPINSEELEACLFRYLDDSLIVKTAAESQAEAPTQQTNDISAEIGSAVDIEAGLNNFDGDVGAYMDEVFDFCDNSRCNDLELDFSMNDTGSYAVNMKKARTSAEAIGLTEIARKALELETAALSGDFTAAAQKHRDFIRIYRAAADNMETAADRYFSERGE